MSIFLNKDSKVIVQGMTGSEGTKHTTRMLASGTNIVGGVNPRKAGQSVQFSAFDGQDTTVPVFGTVADAVKETGANVSVIFVPPKFTKDAVLEAIEAAVPLVVVITEGVPVHDSTNCATSGSPPRSVSAATRSSVRRTSTRCRRSRTTRTPTRSS